MSAKKLSKSYTKHYQSILDFSVDRGAWLAGDTLLSSYWTLPPQLTNNGTFFTPEGLSTIWIGGGVVGMKYEITNTVITTDGATDVRCIYIVITDC